MVVMFLIILDYGWFACLYCRFLCYDLN